MSKIFILAVFILVGCKNDEQKPSAIPIKPEVKGVNTDITVIKNLSTGFSRINILIRDNKIGKSKALKELENILPQLKAAYFNTYNPTKKSEWTFPLEGYYPDAIGGNNGNGYISSGYDYFDGNLHGGHAAHDIFILDKNQDCLDDRTGKFVKVRSVSNGIVVATEKQWDTLSKLRGGKYIWIYDPTNNSLFYYAHNSQVLVDNGQVIKPGDVIATVGRSGLNAFKKRSPTHLHLTQLALDGNNYPRAINPFAKLVTAKSN